MKANNFNLTRRLITLMMSLLVFLLLLLAVATASYAQVEKQPDVRSIVLQFSRMDWGKPDSSVLTEVTIEHGEIFIACADEKVKIVRYHHYRFNDDRTYCFFENKDYRMVAYHNMRANRFTFVGKKNIFTFY